MQLFDIKIIIEATIIYLFYIVTVMNTYIMVIAPVEMFMIGENLILYCLIIMWPIIFDRTLMKNAIMEGITTVMLGYKKLKNSNRNGNN